MGILGTVVASKMVQGNPTGDTYSTHLSILGTGGFSEVPTIAKRNLIPIDSLSRLEDDGYSSGRRRLGQLVYVQQTNGTYQLYIPYNTWTGLTSSGKVSALADNNNWIDYTTGGGEAIKKRYTQAAHGFKVGDVISFNGSIYVKGIASAGNIYEFVGIASAIIDVDNFVVTYSGFMDLSSMTGMSANTTYYVSPSIAGKLTPIEPFTAGESSVAILYTQTADRGIVTNERGYIIPEGGITGNTGGAGTGLRIEKSGVKLSHGFVLGDVVKYTTSGFVKAIATVANKDFPVGLINNIFDADTFRVCFAGYVDGMGSVTDASGNTLTSGSTYYLSPTLAGKLTKVRPTSAAHLITPIYQSYNSFDGVVINQKGLPAQIPISGVTGLVTALNNKIETSLIGAPNGVAPLDANSYVPLVNIPPGLKEGYVVPNIATRDAKFYASGDTGTTAQTESFRGLRVFVIQAYGAPELPVNFSGSSEFIDTTGFLDWSGTTGNVNIDWPNITNKPNLVNKISGGTAISVTNNGTGFTTINTNVDNKYVSVITSADTLTVKLQSIDITRLNFQKTFSGTTGNFLVRGTGTTIQAIPAPAAVIGAAEDGNYTDGVFTDFTPTTPIGTAVDRFNELFSLLLPQPPSGLTNINSTNSFVGGKLSWGASKNDTGFVNVGTNAGNAAVDINGLYTGNTGSRLGLVNITLNGFLNSTNLDGDPSGTPYLENAFADGDKGRLVMLRNGSIISQLSLTGTTGITFNNRMVLSAIKFVRTIYGTDVPTVKYRTGYYVIPTSGMTNGFNYIQIIHSASTFTRQTNLLEFVYDPDASNLTFTATGLTNLSLGGTRFISGVKYHTGGTVQYQGTIANAYKNVYSSLSTAIDFTQKTNLGSITTMNVTGAGIVPRIGSSLQTLPNLDTAASNPQNTSISVLATMPISNAIMVGSGATIQSALSVKHPFTSQQLEGGLSNIKGFLIYNNIQASTLNSETYTGEVLRLQDREYPSLTYANVQAGTYNWDSTQSLIGGSSFHNTGMLVFNGELIYPNAAYLTSTYGITTGNFAGVTNSPAGNVNYTSASGIRKHYRKFQSQNGVTQSTLTFSINHTGAASDFIITGGTGGTATANKVKLEFTIMRSNGSIYGWANPFALSGNPLGISNTSISHSGLVTTITCSLSITPRVGFDDLVIVRTLHSSSYTNRINTLSITNI